MHIQVPVPGWTEALQYLPAGALVKSVSNPGVLREAKQKNPAVITDYRHYDFDYNITTDYQAMRAMWRRNFFRFVDGTYLREYAPFIDLVEELNEYTDTRHVNDPALLAPALTSARAAVDVWNSEFRGRTVHSPDGGEGAILAHCRLVIGNVPVGNDIAREYMQLAISSDSAMGEHPYIHASVTQWPDLVRDPGDWRYHSGRWHFLEQQYGLRPIWAFTETGPYMGAAEGWRHGSVLAGNEALLVEIMRAWVRDVANTPAYREGRILGPGAWFTTAAGQSWAWYELETAQLVAIARMMGQEWRPGTPAPIQEDEMSDADRATLKNVAARLRTAADELDAVAAPSWWSTWASGLITPSRKLKIPPAPIQVYRADGTPIPGITRQNAMDVFERVGALLRVVDKPIGGVLWWVQAKDVQPA